MSAPRIGELCAGYGGLGMGVSAAIGGGDVAWVADVCKITKQKDGTYAVGHHSPCRAPCTVLAHRYPDAPNLGDITLVDWTQVEPVEVLCGGTPCTDLSAAGKRLGMTEGTRSNLWVAMREAIAALRPSLVVWENVGGAYSATASSELESDDGLLAGVRRRDGGPVLRALGRVLGDLASLGYVGGWHGLRAADVGAAHGRLRVFVVAWLATDAGQSGRGSVGWLNTDRRDTDGRGRADGPRASGQPSTLLPTPRTSDTNGAGAHGDGGPDLRTAISLIPTPLQSDAGPRGGTTGFGLRDWSRSFVQAERLLPTPTTTQRGPDANIDEREGARANLHNEVAPDRWGKYAAAITRHELAFGRTAPAPTETGPRGNPRLSCRFDEWLMGLPDGWITDVPGITHNETLRMCGNGVVPRQAEVAVRTVLARAGQVAA